MALNFPVSANIDDTYTDGTTTWKWDGSVWNIADGADGVALFKTVAGDSGSATATIATDVPKVIDSGRLDKSRYREPRIGCKPFLGNVSTSPGTVPKTLGFEQSIVSLYRT